MVDTPAIDYTSKDFEGFKESLFQYASRVMPEWTSRSQGDFGVVMVQMFSYLADILSLYGDRIGQEAYLPTATQRLSVLNLARLLGYRPSGPIPATGTVMFQSANPGPHIVIPAGMRVATDYIEEIDGPLYYEVDEQTICPGDGGTVSVPVSHGETYREIKVGTGSGLPHQSFRIPNAPVIDDTVEVWVESAQGLEQWQYTEFLLDADPHDKMFTTATDVSGATWVTFGDGINGSPITNGMDVFATYRIGGGSIGNIGPGQVTFVTDETATGLYIALDGSSDPISSEMTGGVDAETTEQIRAAAPLAFRTQDRAVTIRDYEDLTLTVPGVLKAKAIANHFTNITVYIVGPNGQIPVQQTLDRAREVLTQRSLAGVSISVSGVVPVGVDLGTDASPVSIEIWPRYSRSAVKTEVEKALSVMLSVTNVELGARIAASDFYRVLTNVEGVRYVDVPAMSRADESQNDTKDLTFRSWELPTLGEVSATYTGGVA